MLDFGLKLRQVKKTRARKPPTKTLDAQTWKAPDLLPSTQAEFLKACWNLDLPGVHLENEIQPFHSYFDHYAESCEQIPVELQDLTHEDVCTIMKHLRDNINKTREEISRTLSLPSLPNPPSAQHCLEFIGRAVLLLSLWGWRDEETLSRFVLRAVGSNSKQKEHYRLPQSFNARVFDRVANIQIQWTRDLLTHLEVGSDWSTLEIFPHKQVLDLYEHSDLKLIFPKKFLDETRKTLSLMLSSDKVCKDWFTAEAQQLGLDLSARSCGFLAGPEREIQRFNFWRDRLIIAKETFDSSQPTGLLQFWRDDRNKVQWWTFWIAAVVFFLTVVGVIEGALQVYKAYHPTGP